ncbi:GroES-like protein [Xylariaceae sp. FL0255]|nr:GroES-like protein [Xylariaceae sp. FL0255]
METAKALVLVGKGEVAVKDVPLPKLYDGHVLVKVHAVGLNPTDWKTIDGGEEARFGSRPGCDFAGEVVEIGPALKKDWKKGDRVAGWVFGASQARPDSGAFGEYLAAPEHVALKIPDNVTYEEAATFGVSVTTVGQGLYKVLQLPSPDQPTKSPFPILIYGGSTATGIYGIRYAKLSGLTVIATSSPHNFDLLKLVGADHVFDYKSPTVGSDIRALTDNKLKYAWDTTGYGGAICAAALSDSDEGGKPQLATIIPIKREVVDKVNPAVDGPHWTLAYDAFGVEFMRGGSMYKVDPEEIEYAQGFWILTQELLANESLKPLKPEVNRFGKGFEGIQVGLEELRNDRVSGTKLVYTF